ncbi:MAG: hypothetical protein KAW02_01350 [candidate division Zixibacteria bacterium]|nr:hypothetical protein [candidate division Zixibacteria bacterium]
MKAQENPLTHNLQPITFPPKAPTPPLAGDLPLAEKSKRSNKMKRNLLLLAVMVLVAFGFSGFAVADQDPNDNGVADTLYLECYPGDDSLFEPGPWLVRVPLYVTNDIPDPAIDSIMGFCIPLCYTHTNPGKYCSLSGYWNNTNLFPLPDLDRSIFRHLPGETNIMMSYSEDLSGREWDSRFLNLDGTSHFWFVMTGSGIQDQNWPGGSRQLLATMTFKLEDTMTVCIDSCFWPPSSRLAFGRSDAETYIPQIWDDYLGEEEYCFGTSIVEPTTFIAHFMTPEGEPYPFDVVISDGEHVDMFAQVTYIETEVPNTATYKVLYYDTTELARHEVATRFELSFPAGYTGEFNFYAITLEQMWVRTPYIFYEELGADPTLFWYYDANADTLSWTLTKDSGRVMYSILITNPVLVPPCSRPQEVVEACTLYGLARYVELEKCYIHQDGLDVCSCLYDLKEHGPCPVVAGSVHGFASFGELDPSWGTVRPGYGLRNDCIITYPLNTTLLNLDGTQAGTEQLFDPPHAAEQGNYILWLSNPPDMNDAISMPVKVEASKCIPFDFFAPELASFTFSITACAPFASCSSANLVHVNDSLLVNVGTDMLYPYWGCFVLPTSLTVDSLFAYSDTLGEEELTELYDFTINHIEGSDLFLVVVRNEHYYDRLKLEFASRGDVTGDGVVNIGDVVYLINYLFRGGPPPCQG